jgi:hypothetical protein
MPEGINLIVFGAIIEFASQETLKRTPDEYHQIKTPNYSSIFFYTLNT